MRPLLLSLVLIVAGLTPALAFDTPEALLKALYAPYLAGDSFDWSTWDEASYRSASLNALFDKAAKDTPEGDVGPLDFDPYVDGQDYQISDLVIGAARPDSMTAIVEVTFNNFESVEDLTFILVKQADGWKIDEVVSAGEYPYSLRAILETPVEDEAD